MVPMYLLTLIGFFALGAILSSFVGVVVERVHTGQSWMQGRSRCDSCSTQLTSRDLVPLLSWLLTAGHCRHCGSKLGSSYLFFEIALGIVFVLSYMTFGLTAVLPFHLAALTVILFIVRYDVRHTIIAPNANALLALIALIFAYSVSPELPVFGSTLLVAGCIGFGFFLLHALSKGRAMGLGDAPFAFSLALLTAPYAFGGLLLSFWIGAAYGIVVLLARRGGPTMGTEVPFAPFLALGFILAYFFAWNPLLPIL